MDGQAGQADPRTRSPHIPHIGREEVTVHYRFHPLAEQRVALVGSRSLRSSRIMVVADAQRKRYRMPLWMTLPEASQWGCATPHAWKSPGAGDRSEPRGPPPASKQRARSQGGRPPPLQPRPLLSHPQENRNRWYCSHSHRSALT